MTPVQFCVKYIACPEGREFALKYKTMSEVWEACERASWLLWILEKHATPTKEQFVRLAILFAESCLRLIPEGEDRPRLAVEAAKTWLADPSREHEIAAARAAYAARADDVAADEFYDAAYSTARTAVYAAYSAADAVGRNTLAAAYTAHAAARAAAVAPNDICKIIRSTIPNPFLIE